MKTYVALLRGINVGGHNKVPMAELRRVFADDLGLADVRTYIQSGNVVFDAVRSADAAPDRLAAALSGTLGLKVPVVVRGADEVAAVLAADPFPAADRAFVHVGFMDRPPSAQAVESIDVGAFRPEEVVVRGAELFLHVPSGMGRAKLPPVLDRRLGVTMTVRNWATVTKLARLMGR